MRFHLPKAAAGAVVAFGALAAITASVTPAAAAPNAETSIFVAYPQGDFRGMPDNIDGCGGHDLPPTIGSYQWIARGQSANLYNAPGEFGPIKATLSSNQGASSTTSVGWKSIRILC